MNTPQAWHLHPSLWFCRAQDLQATCFSVEEQPQTSGSVPTTPDPYTPAYLCFNSNWPLFDLFYSSSQPLLCRQSRTAVWNHNLTDSWWYCFSVWNKMGDFESRITDRLPSEHLFPSLPENKQLRKWLRQSYFLAILNRLPQREAHLVVSNLVVCKLYAEAFFCAVLRPFGLLCILAFSLFCVFLCRTVFRTTAFGNFRKEGHFQGILY